MSELKEREPDGGLAELIEFYEEMGGEDDAKMLVLLLELRRHRVNSGQLDAAQQRIAALDAELARRDAAAGEPVYQERRYQFIGKRQLEYWADVNKDFYGHLPESEKRIIYLSTPPAPSAPDGWIKCSDRMPAARHEVLVGCYWGNGFAKKWATYIPGHPDAQSRGWLLPGASWTPTHWHELPIAPESD